MVATVLYPIGLTMMGAVFVALVDELGIVDVAGVGVNEGLPPSLIIYVCTFLSVIGIPMWLHRHAIMYHFSRVFLRVMINIFFRQIRVIGEENVPSSGPMILIGNHNNQFVDGMMFLTTPQRHVRLLMAAKSLKRPGVGWFGAAMRSIPVRRPQDEATAGKGTIKLVKSKVKISSDGGDGGNSEEKTVYKVIADDDSAGFMTRAETKGMVCIGKATAKIDTVISDSEIILSGLPNMPDDQSEPSDELTAFIDGKSVSYSLYPYIQHGDMYGEVFRAFSDGAVVGIFPEGGSHDRAELLPIKAGVAIMAFEAMKKDPTLEVPIVPCGLNYYRGHRFRGRCVLYFGPPLVVTRELFAEYTRDRIAAVNSLMSHVRSALRNVVLEFPDHQTLRVIQTMRNLFKPEEIRFTARQHFSLMICFKRLHNVTKDEPKMKELEKSIIEYHQLQEDLGVGVGGSRDYERSAFGFKALIYALYFFGVSALALIPGVLLNAPVGFLARLLSLQEKKRALAKSAVKRTGKDVVASYKIIVCFFALPAWYALFSLGIITFTGWPWTRVLLAIIFLPFASYLGIMFTEQGVITSKRLYPMLLRFLPSYRKNQDRLSEMRRMLQAQVRRYVDAHGSKTKFYEDCPVTPGQVSRAGSRRMKRQNTFTLDDDDVIPSL